MDFGGGTLDISIVEAFENVVEIRAISGDNHLGGSDFDEAIMDCFLEENGLQRKELLPQELALLKTGVERAKMLLSVRKEYSLQLFLHQEKLLYEIKPRENDSYLYASFTAHAKTAGAGAEGF